MKKLLLTLSMILGLNTSALMAELTQTQLNATLGIVTNFILDDGIAYHGKNYGTVTSPYTGRVWLDRNLGASQVCTSLDDTECYGDYYQWGRGFDGHQDENSTVTTTQVSNAISEEFVISNDDWASLDSNGAMRVTSWLKTDGTSVCPIGFRVPTTRELKAELLDAGSAEVKYNIDAYDSFLKLPSAGYRGYNSATLIDQGLKGYVWTSSSYSTNKAYNVHFENTIVAAESAYFRAQGFSVRCIEKIKPEEHVHKGTVYGVVTSPYTGKIWLDRNLGAKRVCTSFDDPLCYGDYYQWGRDYDGHQDENSATTTTLATNINYAGSSFIISPNSPYDWSSSGTDDNGSLRLENWSKTDGTSVCPVGFRVPNLTELRAETLDEDVINRDTAFTNFLNLPSAGKHSYQNGNMTSAGFVGNVWTSSVNGFYSTSIYFGSIAASWENTYRAKGFTVRCLKD